MRTHGAGVKHFRHHIVGDLTLAYESLDLRAEPGLTMTVCAAEPGSPTAHALTLLASWAATAGEVARDELQVCTSSRDLAVDLRERQAGTDRDDRAAEDMSH